MSILGQSCHRGCLSLLCLFLGLIFSSLMMYLDGFSVLVLHAPAFPISLNVFVIDCALVCMDTRPDTEGNPESSLSCAYFIDPLTLTVYQLC